MCMLHGVTVDQVLTTATMGWAICSSVKPAPRSMARAGALAAPLVIASERLEVVSVITLIP